MTFRSFHEDAAAALQTALPVPRGIAIKLRAERPISRAALGAALPGWSIRDFTGMPEWLEAQAPAEPALSLAGAWEKVREIQDLSGVADAEPLLLIALKPPKNEEERKALSLRFGNEELGLWGVSDSATNDRVSAISRKGPSDWHLKQLNVREAWQLWRTKFPEEEPGQGILVGHPDTGYTLHVDLDNRVDTAAGRTFLRDDAGNELPGNGLADLHKSGLENPGHGTGTASIIVSGPNDMADRPFETFGVAPGAKILPLCVARGVIHFDFTNLTHAILYAIEKGARVISMSLGGPAYSQPLRDAIQKAHDAGVIVVSAAGNYLPLTVFPAAFPEVLGVAATNEPKKPWRYSGMGRLVDICAPGEGVFRATAGPVGNNGKSPFKVEASEGTSFATACVAGLAALWLSYWRAELAGFDTRLIPFAFACALTRTANRDAGFFEDGYFGSGIADALRLLQMTLPTQEEALAYKQEVLGQRVNRFTFLTGLFTGGMGAAVAGDFAVQEEEGLLDELLGKERAKLGPELLTRISVDTDLLSAYQHIRRGQSLLPFLEKLLQLCDPGRQESFSPELCERLRQSKTEEEERLQKIHRGKLTPGVRVVHPEEIEPCDTERKGKVGARRKLPRHALPGEPTPPSFRRLRAFAFDPSLATRLDTDPIHQVTIPVMWEDLQPGPIGEYLEVVDVDPASGCAYSPVDLNHPYLLAQDGLPTSSGSPQFHQQMVYAVAMNTINRFELAMGRPVFWAPLSPWMTENPAQRRRTTPEAIEMDTYLKTGSPNKRLGSLHSRYVRRLRIYPHALREANAYYSPDKRALLFGYFPGQSTEGSGASTGTVFTCLSHDIIAHETTHALLDGMHPYFNEPSNPDAWAFHEAFADIMALFQHFTYPEVLEQQIANTRGDLEAENLLGQLAQEFGRAIGGRSALRDALGSEVDGKWQRRKPDNLSLQRTLEPHARGSILVAAVFDAFIALYKNRTADLLRLASGGTGILAAGSIHPDLVNRLAQEAVYVAEAVLRASIRAMDYVAPVDITFGDFLRALVTADYDLHPTDRRTRLAFIQAFQAWGIRTDNGEALSEENLRWEDPRQSSPSILWSNNNREPFTSLRQIFELDSNIQPTLESLRPVLQEWQPGCDRADIFAHILLAQERMHDLLKKFGTRMADQEKNRRLVLPGIDLTYAGGFSVSNLRPARRIGSRGEYWTEMVVEIVQTYDAPDDSPATQPLRGGVTLIIDMDTWDIRYMIYRRLFKEKPLKGEEQKSLADRVHRTQRFQALAASGAAGAALAEATAEKWKEAGDACKKRKNTRQNTSSLREPFALLHREGEEY